MINSLFSKYDAADVIMSIWDLIQAPRFWPCEYVCNCFPVQRLSCGIWPLDPVTLVFAWTAKTAIQSTHEYRPSYRDRTSNSLINQNKNTDVFFWGYIPKPQPRYKVWGWKYWWKFLSDQKGGEKKKQSRYYIRSKTIGGMLWWENNPQWDGAMQPGAP